MGYCDIDLHVEYKQICILGEAGEVVEASRVRTSRLALTRFFGCREPMRIALETGGSSPWVSRLLGDLGHGVIVCCSPKIKPPVVLVEAETGPG